MPRSLNPLREDLLKLAVLLAEHGIGSAYETEEQPFWKVLQYNVRLHAAALERERAQKAGGGRGHSHPALANHPAFQR